MSAEIIHGDCLDVMPTLADNSVDLIATDRPYYRVKGEAWDRQWKTPALVLAQVGPQWRKRRRGVAQMIAFPARNWRGFVSDGAI